jgi:hypothetical protein
MKRFALGCLIYTPERFGLMLVGDFLDAMTGYNEGENERVKSLAELIRISTTLLVNTQPIEGGSRTPHELWPLPWDKVSEKIFEIISEEEVKRREGEMEKILNKIMPG